MTGPDLVPELVVTHLARSLDFWVGLVGFQVLYDRPEEGFAYLQHGTAEIMLDQADLGRTWHTGTLDAPFGRGINLQLSVPDVAPVLDRLEQAGWPLFQAVEQKWYRVGDEEAGVSQFLVQDPDGYLLRVQASLGRRPVPA